MTTRDLTLVALFAGFIAALGLTPPITLAFVPVPITLQTFGVMLAGLLIGPKRASLASMVVIVLVAAGIAVLPGGRTGVGVFSGPTVGFLVGWVPASYVTGLLAMRFDRNDAPQWRRIAGCAAAAIVGGVVVEYACGIPPLGLLTQMGMVKAATVSMAFVPGDIAKAIIAAVVTVAVRRAYPVERI